MRSFSTILVPKDHPRIRGEHANTSAGGATTKGSSPHTRGALTASLRGCRVLGIIPAYAGSTRSRRATPRRWRDHPRIRGEHRRSLPASALSRGSSPHTRGAPAGLHDGRYALGIIPAYAGSTPCCPSWGAPRRDHPRIRGEHRCCDTRRPPTPGSSPHTRGARLRRRHDVRPRGIIPAYAGST